MKGTIRILFYAVFVIAVMAGCNNTSPDHAAMSHAATVNRAIGMIYPAGGSSVSGKVIFTQTDSGVHVSAEVTGLSEGAHGIHIHEFGDCSATDAASAGGHFNPEGQDHGGPADTVRHAGDLGNIVATSDSIAKLDYIDKVLSLNGENSIIGRSIVIHAGTDDMVSQPTGNSGARLACGVIGIAE